jgi:hypothetical protein
VDVDPDDNPDGDDCGTLVAGDARPFIPTLLPLVLARGLFVDVAEVPVTKPPPVVCRICLISDNDARTSLLTARFSSRLTTSSYLAYHVT